MTSVALIDSLLFPTAALEGFIIATIVLFYDVIGDLVLPLLLPYLAWVTYAAALTIWIWYNNPVEVVGGGSRCVHGFVGCVLTLLLGWCELYMAACTQHSCALHVDTVQENRSLWRAHAAWA